MKSREMHEIGKIYILLILIGLTLIINGITFTRVGRDFINLQTQINELQFEQSYIEYVKEDGERQ
jgi:hypothetical protein